MRPPEILVPGLLTLYLSRTDSRCKALLGMDPFMRPVSTEVLEGGAGQTTWTAAITSSFTNSSKTFPVYSV